MDLCGTTEVMKLQPKVYFDTEITKKTLIQLMLVFAIGKSYEHRDDTYRIHTPQKFYGPYNGKDSAVEDLRYWQKIIFIFNSGYLLVIKFLLQIFVDF